MGRNALHVELGRIVEENDLEALEDLDPQFIDCPLRRRFFEEAKDKSPENLYDFLLEVAKSGDFITIKEVLKDTSEYTAEALKALHKKYLEERAKYLTI